MLIHSGHTGKVVAIDYREKAPSKAHNKMFLDKDGNPDPELSRFSHLSAGVPGTVAGLSLALEKFGTLSLRQALKPAITLAEKGFEVTSEFSQSLKENRERLERWDAGKKIFFKQDGSFYEPGDRFVQKDLAEVLKEISRKGPSAFYRGKIAEKILKEMERHGGLISREDLGNYHPMFRNPVHGTYRGYDLYSMSPPSSGGIHIIQILNILEGYDFRTLGHHSAKSIHLMAEAMKRAYADRSKYLGDPDFVHVPVEGLISKAYAAALRNGIRRSKTVLSSKIHPGSPTEYESSETTHFSVVDGEGNAVSNTTTINFSYGSGIIVTGAGFLLNNEMDDFSVKPGVPNAYGLIGGTANAVEPKKRMLSSMSPTIILKDGKPFLVTGSPGGSRIITTTLQVIMNVIDHEMNIQEAVNAPRIHHQWLPDQLRVEEGISPDTIRLLTEMGHSVLVQDTMGVANSILVDPKGILYGAPDPRGHSAAGAGL